MNIFERVKSLDLPFGQYVIVGSGIMEALGMRKANDIDISVTEELFKKLKDIASEWRKEGVDIKTKLLDGDYPISTEELVGSATVIEGLPFMNLDELIKFKQATAREKDFKDIELIEQYLAR